MLFLVDPSVNPIYYKIALFGALLVMAYFEARFYSKEGHLINRKDFLKISLSANAVIGLFLFIPVYWFDLLVLGMFIIRSILVGILYVKHTEGRTTQQARASFIYTMFFNIIVFVGYNLVFFLASLFIGVIVGIIFYI